MLEKNFAPKNVENRLYLKTEPFFAVSGDVSKPTYTIVMPPPNVTGSLHLGHALNDTLQDILVRYKRKKGFDVLWQPGTDHAGIATQLVVERELLKEGITRQALGREAFLEKVWAWKEKSGNTIMHQKRRLCISPDWQRSRFTMDEGLSQAVLDVFVQLYKEGLIYKAKRLVNWDTKLQTAISDLEVENKPQSGHLWYIAYAVEGMQEPLVVATTRPETLFADTAVAVHPEDERYQDYIGKYAFLPITGRKIPIIADGYCDPSKGSGAVKITPGHDMNDFEVGIRHDLPQLNMLDREGKLVDPAPSKYIGLSTSKARENILIELEEMGLLLKAEPISHTVPYSDRSQVEIQPWLTDQWFVDAKTLASPALKAVEEGQTKFFPENWQNTYFEWIRNIQPWCISRQLWWGHQIPAWYGPDGHIFVETSEEKALLAAQTHYNTEEAISLTRETDVLDTWFSSALWPFATLGWPHNPEELKRYYPTAVLTTGFDIIFFWVVRMMMMGLYFTKEVPFKTVYIHALIRDEKGQKMSKSKGNIIDPLELLDEYGADALRFTMAKYASPGRDVKIGKARVETSRNFMTKIWNAAKFLEMNNVFITEADFNPLDAHSLPSHELNQWIVFQTIDMIKDVSLKIEGYRFDLACQKIQQYFWGDFCDVYVECLKILMSSEESIREETKKVAMWAFLKFLNAINPIMPIMTEFLWEHFKGSDTSVLMMESWYATDDDTFEARSKEAIQKVEIMIRFIEEVRSLKGLLGLQSNIQTTLLIKSPNEIFCQHIEQHWLWIKQLSKLTDIQKEGKGIPFVVNGVTFELELGEDVNLEEVKHLIIQKKTTLEDEILHLNKKISNEAFKQAKPDLWQNDFDLHLSKVQDQEKIAQILFNWQ